MDSEIRFILLAIAAIGIALAIAFLLSSRKRTEVLDLTAEEFQFLTRLQEGVDPSKDDSWEKPKGDPLYSDNEYSHIKVFRNGIQARYARVGDLNLARPSTGFQRRYVTEYRTMFYPWDRIAAIYPITINVVRKMGSGGPSRVHTDGVEAIGSLINEAMAYADDGPSPSLRKDKFSTLQVETTDYLTAILSPSISRGVSDMRTIMRALGVAMGPKAKEKVRTKTWLHGFYFILEEPGRYDVENTKRYRGDRTRIMLGDIHKHYALRRQAGYPQRRRVALDTMHMSDISTLDERLRT